MINYYYDLNSHKYLAVLRQLLYKHSQSLHAILGANYWKQQGAIIIAHKAADKEIAKKGRTIYLRALNRQRCSISVWEYG
jgi:hypothetical protein